MASAEIALALGDQMHGRRGFLKMLGIGAAVAPVAALPSLQSKAVLDEYRELDSALASYDVALGNNPALLKWTRAIFDSHGFLVRGPI